MRQNLDEKLARIQTREGWVNALSLVEMEEAWKAFVETCEGGYRWSIYEFDNDLSVRDRIELVLSRGELFGIAAVEHLRARVGETDDRFRALLRNDVSIKKGDGPWWRWRILKYAGEEYAGDIRSLHGIEIEVR